MHEFWTQTSAGKVRIGRSSTFDTELYTSRSSDRVVVLLHIIYLQVFYFFKMSDMDDDFMCDEDDDYDLVRVIDLLV